MFVKGMSALHLAQGGSDTPGTAGRWRLQPVIWQIGLGVRNLNWVFISREIPGKVELARAYEMRRGEGKGLRAGSWAQLGRGEGRGAGQRPEKEELRDGGGKQEGAVSWKSGTETFQGGGVELLPNAQRSQRRSTERSLWIY